MNDDIYQNYWREFLDYMSINRTPYKENWQILYKWAHTKTDLAVKANLSEKWIHVDITMKGENSTKQFDKLKKDITSITKKIKPKGGIWIWVRLAKNKECQIILRLDNVDIEDKSNRKKQFEWLAEKVNDFQKVIKPLIEQ